MRKICGSIRGVAGREAKPWAHLRRGQFLALVQGDRHPVRVNQQMVLGEEPGEQHPVPVFVGHSWVRFSMPASYPRPNIAGLPIACTELVRRSRSSAAVKAGKRLGLIDGPFLQGGRAAVSAKSRAWDTDVFQLLAEAQKPARTSGSTRISQRVSSVPRRMP